MNVYLEFFNLNIQLSLFLQEMLTPDKNFLVGLGWKCFTHRGGRAVG